MLHSLDKYEYFGELCTFHIRFPIVISALFGEVSRTSLGRTEVNFSDLPLSDQCRLG